MLYYVADVFVCMCVCVCVYLSTYLHMCVKVKVLVTQSCPTLCDLLDCSLCPRDSPGKNTGVGSHSLLQGIFLTQGSNPGLLALWAVFNFWVSKERYVYLCVCMYIYVCIYNIYICVHIHICIYTIYTYMYIYNIYIYVHIHICIHTHLIKWASLCEVAWHKGIRAYLWLQVFYPERWLSMQRQTPRKQRMLVEIVYWLPTGLLITWVKQSE